MEPLLSDDRPHFLNLFSFASAFLRTLELDTLLSMSSE